MKIAYEVRSGELAVNDHRVKVPLVNGKLQLTIISRLRRLGDLRRRRACVHPDGDHPNARIDPCPSPRNGDVKVESLVVHELLLAWKGK